MAVSYSVIHTCRTATGVSIQKSSMARKYIHEILHLNTQPAALP